MKYTDKIDHAFSKDGWLSTNIQGFRPRAAQLEMAQVVGRAVKFATPAVVEAGTGTGKTFAYLVPALLSGKKTIVSTGSKNLQDQLFNRDLPTIQKALKYKGKVALLKGRANYLCLERLDQLIAMGVAGDRLVLNDLSKVRKWHQSTKTGDLSECTTIAEDSPILPQLVSTTESCLGSDCPNYKDCQVKETGFGELIPEAELVIFDEAHQLPDIASQYFGQSLTSRLLFDLCKDCNIVYRSELKDLAQLGKAADHLQKTIQDFRLLMGTDGQVRGNLRELFTDQKVVNGLTKISENIDFLSEVIKKSLGRSEMLDKIFERLAEVKNLLKKFGDTTVTGYCYWYEANGRSFGLHITPLTVADKFSEQMKTLQSGWVFTSATLEVGGSFDHFCYRLGISNAEQLVLQSPFDYEQSLLCVPRYLPDSNKSHTLTTLGEMLKPVIEANKGRCFLLCTSYYMMRGFADYLREHTNLNVLLQGETSKAKLLEKFVKEEHSVLVATQSFWEGIDVRGDDLSLVIIDKLPFTSPDEPLFKARMEDCRLQGGDPFNDIQIPEAVITLKQGVGRLIRDVTDRGVVIICDNRLVMRNYGATFLKSLPPSKRTRDLGKVVDFLKKP